MADTEPPAPRGRAARLAVLQARIVACRRCPRLVRFRERVAAEPPRRFAGEAYWARPVPSLGTVSARLLLVGLAPAAHGGNRTGRMFTGDAAGGSGTWVARALHLHGFATRPTSARRGDGFRLVDAYITAALHCVPPDNRPLPAEIARCAPYLDAELGLLRRVAVVVALGRIGFEAYLRALTRRGTPLPRPRPRFAHGARYALDGVTLIASYHPSRQNTQTGKLTWAMFEDVFVEARRALPPASGGGAGRMTGRFEGRSGRNPGSMGGRKGTNPGGAQ
jgi:uracil-DNA glycosylase family 4